MSNNRTIAAVWDQKIIAIAGFETGNTGCCLFVFFKNKTGEDFKNVSMHSFRNTITKTIKNFHSCIRWNVYTKKKKWKNNTNLKKKISHTGKWNKFISKSSQIKGCFWLFYYILTNGNIAYFHASTFVLNFVLNITFDFFFKWLLKTFLCIFWMKQVQTC